MSEKKRRIVQCMNCNGDIDITDGYILLHVCQECLSKPKREPYVLRGGLLVPNN